MKNQTAEYIAKEQAAVRQPVELYKLWTDSGSNYWYYTNGDVAVEFDSNTYQPETINRKSISQESELDVTTISIQFAGVAVPITQYVAQNPIDIVWIEISRLFRDQNPFEKSVIFIGQIKGVSFQGTTVEAQGVSFEHFLKAGIPVWRYQLTCNHKVFDTDCTLNENDWLVAANVQVDATGTILTSATFAEHADDYFTLGEVRANGEARMVTNHAGNEITLIYKMQLLESGHTINALPGCDGKLETCRDKFDNIINSLAFPFIPVENPARRLK